MIQDWPSIALKINSDRRLSKSAFLLFFYEYYFKWNLKVFLKFKWLMVTFTSNIFPFFC